MLGARERFASPCAAAGARAGHDVSASGQASFGAHENCQATAGTGRRLRQRRRTSPASWNWRIMAGPGATAAASQLNGARRCASVRRRFRLGSPVRATASAPAGDAQAASSGEAATAACAPACSSLRFIAAARANVAGGAAQTVAGSARCSHERCGRRARIAPQRRAATAVRGAGRGHAAAVAGAGRGAPGSLAGLASCTVLHVSRKTAQDAGGAPGPMPRHRRLARVSRVSPASPRRRRDGRDGETCKGSDACSCVLRCACFTRVAAQAHGAACAATAPRRGRPRPTGGGAAAATPRGSTAAARALIAR